MTPSRGDDQARGSGAGSNRILVVDDEEDVRQLVSGILQDAGYEVDCASGGGEVIEKMATVRPDLLILDLMMPGIDGWSVLEQTRRMQNPPLVLILSARTGSETLQRGTREGAAAVMSKPFRFHDLLATCQSLLSEERKRPSAGRVVGHRLLDRRS